MADDAEVLALDRATEEKGLAWQQCSDAYLVGYVDEPNRPGKFHTPAIVEMQRRLLVGISDFNRTSTRLTWLMLALTVAIGAIAGLQLWTMLRGGA